MLYLIINREGINNAINGSPEAGAISCPKNNIFDVASSIKADEIILVWEDNTSKSFPLWIVSDKVYLETLAYIDTYVKKYTPFTSFCRVVSLSFFLKEGKKKKNTPIIDADILIGVVIADAHLQFDRSIERENGLPIQAYLSTLSAAIIYAINSGYTVDQIPDIVKNWEAARSLLNIENDDVRAIELLNFWIPVLSNLSNNKQLNTSIDDNDYLPLNVQKFIFSCYKKQKITESEWKILVNGNDELLKAYSSFTGAREDGIESFKALLDSVSNEKKFSDIEIEVILAASLSVIASGTMDYLTIALSISKKRPLIAHWYMLFSGMYEKRQVFKMARSVGNHIRKHLTHNNTLFSKVTSDISYPELKVVLTNKINIVPFITEYSTVIDVEIYPLVKAKFRIRRNSNVVHNETREGVFLTNNEYYEITNALSKATKALEKKVSAPIQQSLFKNEV